MSRPSLIRILALLASVALIAGCATSSRQPAAAQDPSASAAVADGPTGRIEGTVAEQDGSPIGGCRVTVSHPVSGRKWKAQADMEGNFLVFNLPEGSGYRVTFSTPPIWRTTLKSIEVKAGQATRLQIVRRLLRGHGPLSADERVR